MLQSQVSKYQKQARTRRRNTERRHKRMRERVDEIYKSNPTKIRFDWDAVIDQVADEFGVCSITVKRVLKRSDEAIAA